MKEYRSKMYENFSCRKQLEYMQLSISSTKEYYINNIWQNTLVNSFDVNPCLVEILLRNWSEFLQQVAVLPHRLFFYVNLHKKEATQ